MQPTVPYAWQPKGEIIEVPSERSKRLNVLGFLTCDNRFEPFCFEGHVNTDIVIACFDAFAERHSKTKRVVIMDNASIHTSGQFLDCISIDDCK
ncbi:transposase [Candidatus Marithioploca araucensis]|uniref:Transposase n=1 Tax=Candidatus Marithioploca araucensis TaxID=70273 RepID=A0ABT7VWG9_9GAMM|nr:transposase [Candidatus Marithioploca araucensis]